MSMEVGSVAELEAPGLWIEISDGAGFGCTGSLMLTSTFDSGRW